ncbi:MAG: GTPase-activating protein [Trichlorobacter sp.]|jgi:hypothetical protein
MFLLPKGNPLAKNVPVAKLQLPEALDKLKNGNLTGCAIFDFPGADCALVYDGGKLVSAVVHRENKELKDQAALQALVDLMVLANSGNFSVYGFSREMTLAVLGLLNGTAVIEGQEIKQIDFKALMDRIKNEQMTGALQIQTADRTGLIFYKGGATIGFFHDRSATVETSAGEVQQIAGLPGAQADLFIIQNEQAFSADLTGKMDIRKLWEAASGNIFATPPPAAATPAPPAAAPATSAVNSADLEATIIELANQFLGKLGKTLAEKELLNIGGINALKDGGKLNEFLAALEKGSKLLASSNKIKEMSAAISSEAAKL